MYPILEGTRVASAIYWNPHSVCHAKARTRFTADTSGDLRPLRRTSARRAAAFAI